MGWKQEKNMLRGAVSQYVLLRGARLVRTHDGPKTPNIPLFIHTVLGPD